MELTAFREQTAMVDQLIGAEEFESKAENKLSGWGLFGSQHEDAADLLDKAGNSYKLAKSWDKAVTTYLKLASCHLKSESKHEAAQAHVDAAQCYNKTNVNVMHVDDAEAVSCLDKAVNLFCEIGRLNMAARYFKEIAALYESEQNIEQAIVYHEKAAEFFQNEVPNFELDPTFTGTREYRFLADIAVAIDEEDVGKFTDVVKEFDSMTPLVFHKIWNPE